MQWKFRRCHPLWRWHPL